MSEDATLDEFTDAESGESNGKHRITGFGTFPSEWNKEDITECAEIRDKERIPLNSQEREEKKPGDIPYYGANGVLDYIDEYLFDSELILLAEDGGHFEEYQERPIAYRISGKSWVNNHAHILEARDDTVTDYLFYSLEHRNLVPYVSGSTRSKLTQSMLRKVKLPSPPLPEQRKIVTVLYTVDQLIEKTEEIIEQYRRIYAGLLQSEFHGNDEDDSKDAGTLGGVPASWSVVPISEVAEVTMGNSPKSEHYNSDGDGLPFYQGANEFGERSPTPDRWCSAPKKVGKPGDTLLNIRSHTNVGKVNKAHHECCIGRGLAAITPGEKIDEDYLYHHLRERENYINSIASGSTFDSVNTEEVESVKIALPPMDTQQKIASSLSNIQNGILKQKEIAEKFDRVKRGLMQDLLSGKVRTTDTNIAVPEEVAQHG